MSSAAIVWLYRLFSYIFTHAHVATVLMNCTCSGFSFACTRSPRSTLWKESTSCTTKAVPTRLRVPSIPHATTDWWSYSGQSLFTLNTLTLLAFSGITSTDSWESYASRAQVAPTSVRSLQRTFTRYWPSLESSRRMSVEPSSLKRICT